jgi:hypothetical protein
VLLALLLGAADAAVLNRRVAKSTGKADDDKSARMYGRMAGTRIADPKSLLSPQQDLPCFPGKFLKSVSPQK